MHLLQSFVLFQEETMVKRIIGLITSIIVLITSIVFLAVPKCYEYRNLSYGTHDRNVLDLNIPKKNDGEIGLILYIHGGGWFTGDKKQYLDEVEHLSDYYGYAAATMNYRYVSTTSTMNNILDDIDAALACIKQKGEENGVNINKVLLTGHSAGGHLSLLYGYSKADTAPIKPAAIISNCGGPVDFTIRTFYEECEMFSEAELNFLISNACGKTFTTDTIDTVREELLEISPITYVTENSVPTIINHGVNDKVVPYHNAEILDKKLTECGVPHVLNPYPTSGHNLDSDFSSDVKADKLFVEYCETYLK